ncbi:hypothetical protein D3C75_544040 [compost metagenome]
MQRPSAAKLWQMPMLTALPRLPGCPERLAPLEVQATSYLAEAVKISSFSIISTETHSS